MATKNRARRFLDSITAAGRQAYQSVILGALQDKPVYQGIDDTDVAAQNRPARRRAKNKVARASRKKNRR